MANLLRPLLVLSGTTLLHGAILTLPCAVRADTTYSLSGVITLEGLDPNAPAQTVLFLFIPVNGADPFTRTVQIDANGNYHIDDIPPGTYDIGVMCSGYLGFTKIAVNLSAGNQTLSGTLYAGDADNSGTVDIGDFGILINSYNTQAGDAGYNTSADLNHDGRVDIGDFGQLINNYNKTGDPPPIRVPGKWYINYKCNGTSSVTIKYANGAPDYSVTNTWDDNPYQLAIRPNDGLSAHYESKGTIKVTCDWDKQDPNAPGIAVIPPDNLLLAELSEVLSEGYNSGVLNNGYGDPTCILDDDGQPTSANSDFHVTISRGIHYTQHRDASTGHVEFEHYFSGVLDEVQGVGSDSTGIQIHYRVSEDPHSVTITCPPLETPGNWHKEGDGLTARKVANVRNPDGSITVDTVALPHTSIFYYTEIENGRPVTKTTETLYDWWLDQTLTANPTEFDLADTWTLSDLLGPYVYTKIKWTVGGGKIANNDSGVWLSLPVHTQGIGHRDANGKMDQPNIGQTLSAHVKVNDTSVGNASFEVGDHTAENDYAIRLHFELENPIVYHSELLPEIPFVWSDRVQKGASTPVDMVSYHEHKWWIYDGWQGLSNGISGVLGSGSVGLLPGVDPRAAILADILFNVIGYAVAQNAPTSDEIQPQQANYDAFLKSVEEEYQRKHGTLLNPPNNFITEQRIICSDDIDLIHANPGKYWGEAMTAKCHSGVEMRRYYFLNDGYDINDYTGPVKKTVDLRTGFSNVVWQWTITGLPGNPPPGP